MKSFLPLLWIILIAIISLLLEQPTSVQPADSDNFSAMNAMKHIEVMASEPHFIGTKENEIVKDYILSEFEKLGIPTEVFVSHSRRQWGDGYVRMARTENIIATIKGSNSKKAVLVAGHYDSVISAPGAADDVHSIACMLESAKFLTKEDHENDIIFLITDGEEIGLFGAQAYSEQKDISNIGVVLNYEARGNSGGSISFEWSDGNAWLVKQLRKVAKRPLANSMSYEIYKNLPNDTDFTFFKKAGLIGINHAFIDGFSYYHNPDDTPENINKKSVQHTGENMLRLTKHFANIDLSNTKTDNASFFNLLSFLVIYPSSWDIALLVLTLLSVIFILFRSFKSKVLTIKSYLLGLVGALLIVILSALFCFGISKLLFILYPHYDVFYAGQFYNHKWYLLTATGITLFISTLIVGRYKSKKFTSGLKAAAITVFGMLCIAIFVFMPTASYFMLFPTLFLAAYYFIKLPPQKSGEQNWMKYFCSIVPLAMWIPLVPLFFLAFSIVGLPGPAILIALICLATFILFEDIWFMPKIMSGTGLALIVLSFAIAHLTSTPTESKPLPSSLFYNYNVTTQEARWATEDNRLNIGNEELLEGATDSEIKLPHSREYWNVKTDVQPHVKIPNITIDTTTLNSFTVVSDEEIYLTRFYMEDPSNIQAMYVNEQEVFKERSNSESIVIDAYAMQSDTLRIRLVKADESIQQLVGINSNVKSLPIKDVLPKNSLRVDGFTDIVQEITL